MAASRASLVPLAFLTAALFAHPAHGGPEQAPATRIVEILQRLDLPEPGESPLAQHLARVGVSSKYGLTYTRHLDRGEKGMRLRLRGPALGRKQAVGLSFEIHF